MAAMMSNEIQVSLVGTSAVIPHVKTGTAEGARRDDLEALRGHARAADGRGGRRARLQLRRVVRHDVSGRHAARDRHEGARARSCRLLKSPELAKRYAAGGIEPLSNTPEEFAALIKRELPRWHKVVKEAKIKVERAALMKAIQITETGGPDVLKYVELPTPRPGPGEVLVKAHAIGVCMPETYVRKGTYRWMPPLPVIPGIEMSGTVVEAGSGVTQASRRARTCSSPRASSRSAAAATPSTWLRAEDLIYALPDGVDLDQAAGLANYQVAWHLLNSALKGFQYRLGAGRRGGGRRGHGAGAARESRGQARHRRGELGRARGLRARAGRRRGGRPQARQSSSSR